MITNSNRNPLSGINMLGIHRIDEESATTCSSLLNVYKKLLRIYSTEEQFLKLNFSSINDILS